MMERGAIGELIPESGESGDLSWEPYPKYRFDYATLVKRGQDELALFYGPKAIRLERVALFLTTEQS